MWHLESWYRWTYLLGNNRDADIENRGVDTGKKGECGTNWEFRTEMCTLLCVRKRATC